jgi:hypothetical protein
MGDAAVLALCVPAYPGIAVRAGKNHLRPFLRCLSIGGNAAYLLHYRFFVFRAANILACLFGRANLLFNPPAVC